MTEQKSSGLRIPNIATPMAWVLLWAMFIFTGNCSCLGFDRDYVGEAVECEK